MNTTQPRVRITPAGAGGKWWLIRCGACPATDVHYSLPDSHDWATRHAVWHVLDRTDREDRKTYRTALRAAWTADPPRCPGCSELF